MQLLKLMCTEARALCRHLFPVSLQAACTRCLLGHCLHSCYFYLSGQSGLSLSGLAELVTGLSRALQVDTELSRLSGDPAIKTRSLRLQPPYFENFAPGISTSPKSLAPWRPKCSSEP